MTVTLDSSPLAPVATPRVLAVRRAGTSVSPELRDAFVAGGNGGAVEGLYADGALCVTTGQQPGLLTGPLFTIYKAATAVALARRLRAQLGRPVVPVFWVAGDDHDFAEANHVHILTPDNVVERLSLRDRDAGAPLTPLYREPLGPEIEHVLRLVEDMTPDTEFRSDVLEWLGRHYRPDQNLASAFADAMADLLASHGLVVLRPTHPAAKRTMAPLLLRALERAADVDRDLAGHAESLRQAGGDAPVSVGDGATMVMLESRLGRDRLIVADGRFHTRRSGESWSWDALQQLAEDEPERLSPNVLLRPVVEAAMLPTVAYVAGPGELAYLPQCMPLYRLLDVERQTPYPRWSGRVLEPRVVRVLEKYGLAVDDLAGPAGRTEAALVREDMPDDASEALTALRGTLADEYSRLERAAEQIDPTMRKAVRSTRNNALAGVADLEKRLVQHLKKQNQVVVQQLGKARNSLFPLGKPQERVFTIAPFLVRYGQEFVDAVVERADEYVAGLDATDADT